MIHNLFCMIKPKQSLLLSIDGEREDIVERLSTPLLWTGQFPHKGFVGANNANDMIKFLFLLDISGIPQIEKAIVSAVGEEISYSSKFFDRLWTIEQLYEDNNIQEFITNNADNPKLDMFLRSIPDNISGFVSAVLKD